MIEFIIGIAIGAAFSPFWILVWNSYIKPVVEKLFKNGPPPPSPPPAPAA
jgi:hypothetical protein